MRTKPILAPVEELLKKDYLTINEYCKAYSVSRATVSRNIKLGNIETIKVGSSPRIKNINKIKE